MSVGRRSARAAALLAAAAAAACGGAEHGTGPSDAAARPQSIALITVDGLAPAELRVYGGAQSAPALEALAARGRAWSHASSPCPMTRPAVAAMMTGVSSETTKVFDDVSAPLDPGVPTLAEALHAAGYATGAFPGSASLGASSGLTRGFDIVDEPPSPPFGPARRVPVAVPAADRASHATAWVRSLPKEARAFVWIHLQDPWRAAFGEGSKADALRAVDEAVRTISSALDERGGVAVVALAGTFGDVGGGTTDPPGPGFSIAEGAVRVPLIVSGVRRPGTAASEEGPVSTLDVPATLARLAGTRMGAAAGSDLLAGAASAARPPSPASWAPWEECGWRPLGADASASAPGPPHVDAAAVSAILLRRDVAVRAAPEGGRGDVPPDRMREAVAHLWEARARLAQRDPAGALAAYDAALRADPDNLAGLVESGIVLLRTGRPGAQARLTRAAAVYPWSADAVHWYGHALGEDRSGAEPLWMAAVAAVPGDADLCYDLACTRSLAGDLDGSLVWLRRAVSAGFRRWETIQADPDLRNLRRSPKFAALMRELGQ